MADLKEMKSLIRSMLISSPRNLSVRQLAFDFKSEEGYEIPFQKFGCDSLINFLRSIPDTVQLFEDPVSCQLIVTPVQNEKTQHVDELVSRQKISKPKSLAKPKYVPPFRRKGQSSISISHRGHGSSSATYRTYASTNSAHRQNIKSPSQRLFQSRPPVSPPPVKPPPVKTERDNFIELKSAYIKSLQNEVLKRIQENPDGFPLHEIQDEFITNRPMCQKYVSNVEDFMNVSKDLFRSVRGMVYLASCYSDSSSSGSVQRKLTSVGGRENDQINSRAPEIKPQMSTNVKPFSSKFRDNVPPRFQTKDYTYESRNKVASSANQTNHNTALTNSVNSSKIAHINSSVNNSKIALINSSDNLNKYNYELPSETPSTVYTNSNGITDPGTQHLAKAMDRYMCDDTFLSESDSDSYNGPQFDKNTSNIKGSGQDIVKSAAPQMSSKPSDQLSKFNSYMNHYDAVFRKNEPNMQGAALINNFDYKYKPNTAYSVDTRYEQNSVNCDRESRLLTESPPPLSPPSESNISHHLGDFHIDEEYHYEKVSGRTSRNSVCSQSSSERTSLSVGNKMESNLMYLIEKNPNGILASELQRKYKEQFEVDLDHRSYGCASVIHFASSLPHIFICRKHDSTDWILFGASNKKTRLSGVSADYVQPIVPEDVIGKINDLIIKEPGLTLQRFETRYQEKYGTSILYGKYGFSDLESMLVSLTEKDVSLIYIRDQCLIYRKARNVDPLSPSDQKIIKFDIQLHEDILRCYPKDVFGLPSALSLQELPATCYSDPFTIQLAEVYNPGKFYYQLDVNYKTLDDMMNKMQDFYSTERSDYKMHPKTIVPAQYCAALYKDEHLVVEWTRAKITKIISKETVEVFFIDYGTVSKVKVDDLCYLRKMFAQLPCQARRGSIAGIKPKFNKWANNSGHVLLNLVRGKAVMALGHESKQNSNIDYLSLFETSGKFDIDVGKYLVQEGIALPLSEEEEDDEYEVPVQKHTSTGKEKTTVQSSHKVRTSTPASSPYTYEPDMSEVKVKPAVPPGFAPKTSATVGKPYSIMDTTAPSQYMTSAAAPSSQFMASTALTSSQFMASTAPPPGFMSSYPNSMQTSCYGSYLGNPLMKPDMTDPLMLAQQVANPYLAAAAALQYQQYQYWMAQQMFMASALNTLNMPRPPESALKLTEVDTRCTFSTQTCPSPIETTSTKLSNDEPTLNTNESVYRNDVKPGVARMSVELNERTSGSLSSRYEHKDVASSKNKNLHRKAETQNVKGSDKNNLVTQEKKDEAAVQSPRRRERQIVDEKVNKEKVQEVIERRDVPSKVAESERTERRQYKNPKLPLPPIKNVDIIGTLYHIVWAVDRYYMCTVEIAQHMCNFSGVHVLIKLLDSFGDDIPFLTVNKSNHERVYQALLSSDVVEAKKKDMVQSFHLTPLTDVPKIMQRLNLLHNKLKLGLEGAIEALSS